MTDSLLLLVQVLRDAGLVLEIAGWQNRCYGDIGAVRGVRRNIYPFEAVI